MGNLDIDNAQASDFENDLDIYSVDLMNTDGATGQKETEYQNAKWSQQFGYFNKIPDLKSAILMKAVWNVGKGYSADPETTVILDHVSGWGKDTFDDILFNMEVTKRIGGDAFCEIMRDESGDLVNLKPLDPSTIKIIVDEAGLIKRYEQTSKNPEKEGVIKFEPKQIFHLSHNRLADQIHGISDIDAVESIILADAESFDDMTKVMHRQAKPMVMFKLGTDDTAKIDAFITKMDAATNKGENIYIPDDENSVSYEVIQVNVSQMIMEWRSELRNKFYRALGMPMIVFGSSGNTESGSKIEYLAHEQIFEKDQRHLELQIWNQLNLKINLVPPVSLLENLQTDQSKDGLAGGLNMQQNDITAGSGK